MLNCQASHSTEGEEIFRFDDDDHFHQNSSKVHKVKKSSSSKDANGNQVVLNNFNFDLAYDEEEILSIRPQKNFTFDIMDTVENPRRVINRTSRCFDLSSMYQSLSEGSSEEEDEFELYDYSISFEDMTIEGLRIHLRSCFTCGVHWHEDQASLDCTECGGYALTRPCLECEGKCRETWTRNLDQSHSLGKARWTGTCRSPAQSLPSS